MVTPTPKRMAWGVEGATRVGQNHTEWYFKKASYRKQENHTYGAYVRYGQP